VIEVAVVFDDAGYPLHFHCPAGSSSGAIPDSQLLWDVLWEHREYLGGVAHTHPWNGITGASDTDESTFAAVEAGLGKRLVWPIVTMTHVSFFHYLSHTGRYTHKPTSEVDFRDTSHWHDVVRMLRLLSRGFIL
jgi:hypothetical protein